MMVLGRLGRASLGWLAVGLAVGVGTHSATVVYAQERPQELVPIEVTIFAAPAVEADARRLGTQLAQALGDRGKVQLAPLKRDELRKIGVKITERQHCVVIYRIPGSSQARSFVSPGVQAINSAYAELGRALGTASSSPNFTTRGQATATTPGGAMATASSPGESDAPDAGATSVPVETFVIGLVIVLLLNLTYAAALFRKITNPAR